MSQPATDISPAMRRYAAEIFRLQEDHAWVGLSDLAEHAEVSTQAVSRMVRRMKEAGMVEHQPYQGLRLTELGRREAMPALRRHRLVEVFLVQVMGFDWSETHDLADTFEMGIDDAIESRIDELTGHPTRCPHGDPIPTPEGRLPELRDVSLVELRSGERGVVSRVRTHDPERLRYLGSIGLVPGTSFDLRSCAPFNGPLRLMYDRQDEVLGHELASSIWVERQEDGGRADRGLDTRCRRNADRARRRSERMNRPRAAIWWIRRDLRLADNPALEAALEAAETVLPTFVLDPGILRSANAGPKRVAFMLEGLRALDASLRERGSRLILRRGEPASELRLLADQAGAERVLAEADATPHALARDRRVAEALRLELVGAASIRPVGSVRKADGGPYQVFTPYLRSWKELPLPGPADLLPAPDRLPQVDADIESLPIPDDPKLPDEVPFPAGEREARGRLAAFAEVAIADYAEGRDRLDLDGTSSLSPYLRWGMLSAREAAVRALRAWHAAEDPDAREGAERWLGELIWRDFYADVLYHFPRVIDRSFRPAYDRVEWSGDTEAYEAWCQARTGYPVVDAGMRQLHETGWMHNRARMITASFLVKDLLIDWRWGEHHFMRHLLDGDVASNNGGWQWAAGTGTDAAPYFRIFNPVSQGRKHDPEGRYVRRWLPQLAKLPTRWIHRPWEMPEGERAAVDFEFGRDYPEPIVDHKRARQRTLEAYEAAREGSQD